MPKKLIDLEAIRQAEEKLAKALEEYPELREPNPERQEAFAQWLHAQDQEGEDDAVQAHGEARRAPKDEIL
jgi:hypothetical protein